MSGFAVFSEHFGVTVRAVGGCVGTQEFRKYHFGLVVESPLDVKQQCDMGAPP